MPGLFVKHIGTMVLFALISAFGMAQTAAQYIAKGDKELKDGYYQSAIYFYDKALRMDTNLLAANFGTAEAYRMQRNYKRAVAFYEATIAVDGTDRYPEAYFYIAMMQKQLGKYPEALRDMKTFLSIYGPRDDLYRWARDEETSIEWAMAHESDTAKFEVNRPDSGLNTVHAEMSPFMTDSATIYYSTMRYESDVVKKSNPVFVEIKKAVKDSNIWEPATLDLPIAEDEAHIANGIFNEDTTRFYYSRCATLGDCKIYVAKFENGTWSAPIPLPEPVNEEGSTNTQPCLAQVGDEAYLIFASNRSSGKGGMDLWFVTLKNGEPTTRIRNMGTKVNTKGDEITPYFDNFDSTLYFSSNRHAGFGGFDLFKSTGVPGTSNPVENLGTAINSPADDYYLWLKTADSLGFFTSNRISGLKKSGNETCCNDFYKVRVLPPPPPPLDTLPPDILEVDTLPPGIVEIENPKNIEELQTLLPISLYFHNDRPNPRTMETTTKLRYDETLREYISLWDEYVDAINRSDLDGTSKMEMGDALSHLFQNDLQRSLAKLDKALNVMLQELQDSATINLAVKGFASPLADSDYNLNLTYRRIAAMENYITHFDDGVFVPYLKSGQLKIERIPYGESRAGDDVSDQLNDEINAIYGPKAAYERRIEIMKIDREE